MSIQFFSQGGQNSGDYPHLIEVIRDMQIYGSVWSLGAEKNVVSSEQVVWRALNFISMNPLPKVDAKMEKIFKGLTAIYPDLQVLNLENQYISVAGIDQFLAPLIPNLAVTLVDRNFFIGTIFGLIEFPFRLIATIIIYTGLYLYSFKHPNEAAYYELRLWSNTYLPIAYPLSRASRA